MSRRPSLYGSMLHMRDADFYQPYRSPYEAGPAELQRWRKPIREPQRRSPAVTVLLAVLTLGVYGYLVLARLHDELPSRGTHTLREAFVRATWPGTFLAWPLGLCLSGLLLGLLVKQHGYEEPLFPASTIVPLAVVLISTIALLALLGETARAAVRLGTRLNECTTELLKSEQIAVRTAWPAWALVCVPVFPVAAGLALVALTRLVVGANELVDLDWSGWEPGGDTSGPQTQTDRWTAVG